MSSVVSVPTQFVQPDDGFNLRLARQPDVLIAEASVCASALIAAVRRNGWAQVFGKKEHLFFEAWAFLATMYRVTPRVRESRYVQLGDVIGYEACAEAFHVPSGIVISTADAMCLNDEENWGQRPKYEWQGPPNARKRVEVGTMPVPLFQLRSMAQTRAMAKALRGPFSWIVAMAGFAPRTAEEGEIGEEAEERDHRTTNTARQPQRQASNSSATQDGKITSKQASRIWAIGHAAGKTGNDITAILKRFGFDSASDVTTEKYDAVCAEIEKGDQQ